MKLMDGWMTCSFTSFSTEFQSYQDDGRLIMKTCTMALRLRLRRFRFEPGSNLVRWIIRPALNPLSYRGSKSDLCKSKMPCSL